MATGTGTGKGPAGKDGTESKLLDPSCPENPPDWNELYADGLVNGNGTEENGAAGYEEAGAGAE